MSEQIPNTPEVEPLTRVQVLIAIGITALVLLVIAKIWLRLGEVSLLPIQWQGLAIPVGLGLGLAIAATSSVVYRLWPAYHNSADYYLELVLKPLSWPDIIWLGLLPGLSEELLFRGVMLPAWGLNALALVASSIFFGVLHFNSPKHWAYVAWATIVGGVLGLSAMITGNLLIPIVAHIFTNLLSSCLWKFEHGQTAPK